MPPRRSKSDIRSIVVNVVGAVLAAFIISLLYSSISLRSDVAELKVQQLFYHGTWPPPPTVERRR
jgi:hypothetical protein